MIWQQGYTGHGVNIVVIDTGIDSSGHPAFAGVTVTGLDIGSYRRDGRGIVIDPDDPTGDPLDYKNYIDATDYQGHGTHVASIVAASGGDGHTRGVAYEANVISSKVYFLDMVESITHTGYLPSGMPFLDVPFTITDTASADEVFDVILTYDPVASLTLEIFEPAGVTVPSDYQHGDRFAAATNIPLQGRRGRWTARVLAGSNPGTPFTVTIKRWGWMTYPALIRAAIDDAVNNRQADVINISLSTGPSVDPAIDAATARGVVVVTSAGNTGWCDNCTPPGSRSGSLSSWNRYEITVGATGHDAQGGDVLWKYSSRGPAPDGNTKPDVVAPGDIICAAWSRYSFGDSTGPYACGQGTSDAAPHVAGGVALLIQYFRETYGRKPTPAEVKTLLMNTAVQVGVDGPLPPQAVKRVKLEKDNDTGAGRIDLYRALLGFSLHGTTAGDSQSVIVQPPLLMPDAPSLPVKATLYWEGPFYGFWMGDHPDQYARYTPDTAMATFISTDPGQPHTFWIHPWRANSGEPWYLATTYPPVDQVVGGTVVRGFRQYQATIPAQGSAQFSVQVDDTDAVRILAYRGDHTQDLILTLQDPQGNKVDRADSDLLGDVAAVQVVSLHAPSPGRWTLEVTNSSGGDMNITLASNYPFAWDIQSVAYLPLTTRNYPPSVTCYNYLLNGDFETGSTEKWVMTSSDPFCASLPWIHAFSPSYPDNRYCVYLGRCNGNQDVLYQTVTIPAQAEEVYLSYTWLVTTEEPDLGHKSDVLDVLLRDSSGHLIERLQDLSNNDWAEDPNNPDTWTSSWFDLSDYAGETVQIVISATNDVWMYPTNFYFDWVKLVACGPNLQP